MSAYNSIIVNTVCPACGKQSDIKCQTHVVSSFEGDDLGRFCLAEYKIGDKMRWWTASDYRYPKWKEESNSKQQTKDDTTTECCYAECAACKEEIYAMIAFNACIPTHLVNTGTLDKWPDGFYQ